MWLGRNGGRYFIGFLYFVHKNFFQFIQVCLFSSVIETAQCSVGLINLGLSENRVAWEWQRITIYWEWPHCGSIRLGSPALWLKKGWGNNTGSLNKMEVSSSYKSTEWGELSSPEPAWHFIASGSQTPIILACLVILSTWIPGHGPKYLSSSHPGHTLQAAGRKRRMGWSPIPLGTPCFTLLSSHWLKLSDMPHDCKGSWEIQSLP